VLLRCVAAQSMLLDNSIHLLINIVESVNETFESLCQQRVVFVHVNCFLCVSDSPDRSNFNGAGTPISDHKGEANCDQYCIDDFISIKGGTKTILRYRWLMQVFGYGLFDTRDNNKQEKNHYRL